MLFSQSGSSFILCKLFPYFCSRMKLLKHIIVVVLMLAGFSCFAQDTTSHKSIQPQKRYTPLPLTPEFPGGRDSLAIFIRNHTRYPAKAKKKNISGVIEVDFLVTKDGEITKPHVLKPLGYGCDEEAIRVVKLMPKWKPAMMGRDAMEMDFHVDVPFGNNNK
jgi:protein TonB